MKPLLMRTPPIAWKTAALAICMIGFCGAAPENLASPLGPLSPRTGLIVKDVVLAALIQTSSGDLAHDYVSQIALWSREQVTEGFSQAADWVSRKAKEFGLKQVVIETFASDGQTEYFGNTTALQWKVRKGELWITSPFQAKLTSHAELPMSLAVNSTSANVEAELVDIGDDTGNRSYSADIKGKIVLTSGNPAAVFQRAVLEKGAAGIISSWVSEPDRNRLPGDYPDQVGWRPGFSQGYADHPGHFAFLISARRAQELRALMDSGKTVRIRAVVDAQLIPGNLEVVSGTIPGTAHPDEEIIVTAHLDHYKPGANDNASGSASILEMARTMNRLIAEGQISPPLRTIRFIWVPEIKGTYAWLAKHLNDSVKRIAELNFDMVGEDLLKTNSKLMVVYTSDSNPSFINGLLESVIDFLNSSNGDRYPQEKEFYVGSLTGTRNNMVSTMAPYLTGSDHEVFNNLKIGSTTYGCFPDNFYHSSEDTPDKVDPTQLHRAVVFGLASMTTLAYANDRDAQNLAKLAMMYGRKRIASSEFGAIKSLLSATKDSFAEADRLAGLTVSHIYRREHGAIVSAGALADLGESRSAIEKFALLLDSEESATKKRIEDIAVIRAQEMGITRTLPSRTDEEQRIAKMIPVRNKGMELVRINYVIRKLMKDETAGIQQIQSALNGAVLAARSRGMTDLTVMGIPDAPAFYADGRRSILDIANAMMVEYAPMDINLLELYFKAFEKAGVIRFR